MKEIRIRNPQAEAKALLEMDTKHASLQFQQYTTEEQLAIIETVSDTKSREELYYLVPDCTELVQQSPTENVMQIALAHLGTGQSAGILSAASAEQLADIVDLIAYQNDKLDDTRFAAWLMEMLHAGEEVFENMLRSIDPQLLGEFFWDRLELANAKSNVIPYPAFLVEEALVSPEDLSCDTEDTQLLIEMLYAADGNLFQSLMEYIFLEDATAIDGYAREIKARATREAAKARIEERDREKGVTEEDLEKLVDLNNTQLDGDQPPKSSSENGITEDDLEKLVDLDNPQLDK